MNVVKELKAVAGDFAEVNIIPCGEFKKQWSDKHKDVKHVFTIKIVHKDTRVGEGFKKHDMFTFADIAPSKYMDFFAKELDKIFDKTKLYVNCMIECGNELEYDVMWNRNRAV